MYCSQCGSQIDDLAAVCVHCGKTVDRRPPAEGRVSSGWWWLGFLVPLAGLLIWIFTNDTQPQKARKAGIGALVGVIAEVVLFVLIYLLMFAFMFMLAY